MDGQQILRRLKHYLASLEKMAFQIQHGVSKNGKFDADTYRIPSSLVKAFQHILMMAVTGAHMAKTAYALRERYVDPDPLPSFLTPSESGKVPHFGSEAEVSMENAIRDIVLMTYTDEPSDVVTYEAVSPGLVMALIMGDSYPCRDPQNNLVDLVQTYRDYVLRLVCTYIPPPPPKFEVCWSFNFTDHRYPPQQFKVSQHPHRRLLQDIYLVCEELRIIRRISREQRLVLGNYRNVLNPTSFRITTESRVSSFEREKARLNELILRIDADLAVIDSLVERLDSLATQTRNGVEVQQEDHGKAILVFTVVTVVFMPLSFVTSYLGMNTHDIRDMGSSQGLFWAISLPLTVVIIALVMVLAFQAERIREGFDTWFRHDRASIPKPARTVRRQKGTGKDIGRNSEPSTGVDWWGKNWLSTGKATGTKTKSVSSHVFNV
jgi:Mg2+ and Co2+ transporter CorA